MAEAFISSINKTASGTITVPADTTLIVACVQGSTAPPKIEGVDMLADSTIEATSICPALGIFEYPLPAIATLNFTFAGTYVHFIFLSGADSFRPGSIHGYMATGVYQADMPTTTADIVIGILCGTIGPTTMKDDTVAMTYLVNTDTQKVGYIVPGDTTSTCKAEDTGSTAGYTIPGVVHHNPAYLISAAYFDYPPTWVPGYWNEGGWWQPGRWTYPQTFHPAVWHDAWDTQDPDIVVPAGTSQISACFVSIRATHGGGFVSRPLAFQ
jgi:hypothetical protein